MSFKPGSFTVCPWCRTEIYAHESTARHYGTLFHAGCLEDLIRSDTEVAEVRDATT